MIRDCVANSHGVSSSRRIWSYAAALGNQVRQRLNCNRFRVLVVARALVAFRDDIGQIGLDQDGVSPRTERSDGMVKNSSVCRWIESSRSVGSQLHYTVNKELRGKGRGGGSGPVVESFTPTMESARNCGSNASNQKRQSVPSHRQRGASVSVSASAASSHSW